MFSASISKALHKMQHKNKKRRYNQRFSGGGDSLPEKLTD